MKYLVKLLILLCLFIILWTCKKDETPVIQIPTYKNVVLNIVTKEPEKLKNFNDIQVDSNKLVINFNGSANLPSYKTGDILIGLKHGGYLRKVESVSTQGGSIVINTSIATLDEAFNEIKVDTSFKFTPSKQSLSQINYKETVNIKGQIFNVSALSSQPIMNVNETTGGLNFEFPNMSFKIETADKSGKFELNAEKVKVDLSITLAECVINYTNSTHNKFSLVYKIDCNQEFSNVSMILKGGIDEQIPDRLHEDLFKPDIFLGSFPIGPVIITFYFNLAAGIQGKFLMGTGTSLVSTMNTSSSYLVGGEIVNGVFKGVWDKSTTGNSSVNFAPIANISGISKLFVKPKLNVKLFDIAGPTLFCRGFAYGEVLFPPIKAEWGFGIDGGLGFNVSFLTKKIASIDWVLAEKRWPQWNYLNNLPNLPSIISPLNNSIDQPNSLSLSWSCSDPDGDILKYDVYIDKNNPPSTVVSTGQSSTILSRNGLDNGTTYYWKIVAIDNKGASREGPIWNFKTIPILNKAPSPASNPSPSDGATGVSATPTLSWTCTDPENDPLKYDVFLGTISPPTTQVGTDLTTLSISPNILNAGVLYYWKVIAKDNHSNSTPGPVWSFTTQNSGGSGIIFNPNLTYGSITDIDGNTSKTIQIGSQKWMAEYLKTTKYRNGDLIGTTTPATLNISGENMPKYQWAYGGVENNAATYGRLYTWYAITDNRNVCPTGWHVPTDAEWTTLTTYLGGEGVAGGKLKEIGTTHWSSPNSGNTNQSGFTALPAGNRNSNGIFGSIGAANSLWSFTEYSTTNAHSRGMTYSISSVNNGNDLKRNGFSVRCVEGEVTGGTTGTVTDIDNNVYNTIIIGTQEWMAENLKTTKFNDNSAISPVIGNTAWAALATPAYCWYNNDEATYKAKYGTLYNWYTVNSAGNGGKNVCPSGWHIPSDIEWITLQSYLIANGYNFDGSTTGNNIAKAMASITDWNSTTVPGTPGNTDYTSYRNKSNFNGLPSGGRNATGAFYDLGRNGYWWSTKEISVSYAQDFYLYYNGVNLGNNTQDYKRYGMSLRCVKD